MSVLFVAVPVALLLVSAALAAFVWATRQGQLDDLETPALRILVDEAGIRTQKLRSAEQRTRPEEANEPESATPLSRG